MSYFTREIENFLSFRKWNIIMQIIINKKKIMEGLSARTCSSVAEQLTADQRVSGSIPLKSFFYLISRFLGNL